MFRSDNTLNLLVGNDIARTAGIVINDHSAAAYIADGEIVVLGANDDVLPSGSTFADSRYITVVQRSGATAGTSELIRSQRIYGGSVAEFTGRSFRAPQEQRYFVGYDGAASTITATDSNDYILRISYKHDKRLFSQQANVKSYYYTSDSSAVQEEIARNLAVQIGNDTASDVLAERLCNDGGAAFTVAATLTVTNNSRSVTLSAAQGAALVVGDYIRIAGLTVAFPVYRVTAVSGTSVTIDERYQGASGTAIVGERITVALAAAASFGIRLTGKALTFTVGKNEYNRVSFDLSLSGFGSTAISQFQESNLGNGTFEQVAELEWFAQGFDGIIDRVGDSSPTLRSDATTGETYDVVAIQWADGTDSHIISGSRPANNQLLIALPDGAAQTVNILAQLNPWMASLPKAFAAVSV